MREVLRAECPTAEQLAQLFEHKLSKGEAGSIDAHLKDCSVCRAEWLMLTEFAAGDPEPSEKAEVATIVAALKQSWSSTSVRENGGWRRWFALPRLASFAAAAAVLAIVSAVGLHYRSGTTPNLDQFKPSGEVRSGQTFHVSPQGDLPERPTEFSWERVPNAVKYEVTLSEVDGTRIWTAQTSDSPIRVPNEIRALMLPVKSMVCQVTAFNANGGLVAKSEVARFRFMPSNIQ